MVLIVGFAFIGCDTGNGGNYGDDAFKGTWVSAQIKIVAADGIFNEYLTANNKEIMRGSYTVSGNDLTIKITEVNTEMFGTGADNWVPYAGLTDGAKANVGSETQQITISGNSFTSNGLAFTKQS
jgi:hypothetical protein